MSRMVTYYCLLCYTLCLICICKIDCANGDSTRKNIPFNIESKLCDLKRSTDSLWSISDSELLNNEESLSYLDHRWYRECKSCYHEMQQMKISFMPSDMSSNREHNKKNTNKLKQSSTYSNWKSILMRLLGYQPNKVIRSPEQKSNKNSMMLTGAMSSNDLIRNNNNGLESQVLTDEMSKKHVDENYIYVWGGYTENDSIANEFDISHTSVFTSHIRGPLSHVLAELVNIPMTMTPPNSSKFLDDRVSVAIDTVLTNKAVAYGDVQLLLPLFETNALKSSGERINHKNKLCILPHALDTSNGVEKENSEWISEVMTAIEDGSEMHFIKYTENTYVTITIEHNGNHEERSVFVLSPFQPLKQLLKSMVGCEYIVSNTLEGLILSDSMGIPNSWLHSTSYLSYHVPAGSFTARSTLTSTSSKSNTWEFNDYYLGIGRGCNEFVSSVEEGISSYLHSYTELSVEQMGLGLPGGVHVLSRPKLAKLFSKMFAAFPYRSICPIDYDAFYVVPVLAQTLPSLQFEYSIPTEVGDHGGDIPAVSTHIRSVVRDLPLTTWEQKALLGAIEADPMKAHSTMDKEGLVTRSKSEPGSLTRAYNTHKEVDRYPLLCVSFLKAEESAVDIFLENVRASSGHCDWAVVAYGGSDSQLARLKAEFSSIIHSDSNSPPNETYNTVFRRNVKSKLIYCAFADEATIFHDHYDHEGAHDYSRSLLVAENEMQDQGSGAAGEDFSKFLDVGEKVTGLEAAEEGEGDDHDDPTGSGNSLRLGFTMGRNGNETDIRGVAESNSQILRLIDKESSRRGRGNFLRKSKPRVGKTGAKSRASLKQALYENSRRSELDAQKAEANGQVFPSRPRLHKGKAKGKAGRKQKHRHGTVGDSMMEKNAPDAGVAVEDILGDRKGQMHGNLRRRKRAYQKEQKEESASMQSDVSRKLLSSGTGGRTGHQLEEGKHIPKPAMFKYLLDVVVNYNKIWLLDEDISLVGFDIGDFLYRSTCGVRTAPYAPTALLVTQPLVGSHTQDRISVSFDYWKSKLNATKRDQTQISDRLHDVVGIHTGFVESQAPLFDSDYFVWYTKYIVGPLREEMLQHQSGWGAGHTVSFFPVSLVFMLCAFGNVFTLLEL